MNDTRFDEIYDLSITDSNKFIEYFNNEAEINDGYEQLVYLLTYSSSIVGLAISLIEISRPNRPFEVKEFLDKLIKASKERSKDTIRYDMQTDNIC